MTRCIETDEKVGYRLKKNKSTLLYIIIYFPIWLYLTSLFLIPLYRSVILGETDLSPLEYYIYGMIGLAVFVPFLIFILLSYCANQLIITDKRIYIRKGITGRTQILDMDAIRSFQHVVNTGKRTSYKRLYFYLNCGKIVKTGDLYVRPDSKQALLDILHRKFEDRGFTDAELKELAEQNAGRGQPVVKTNYLIWLVHSAPFILAIILTISFIVGI